LDDYQMYGINGQTNELVRYIFIDSKFESIGRVQFSGGTALTGIKGMAHIPGNLNLYGFWTDPSNGLTKLVYINSETAAATVVGADLGPGEVTGATIAWLQQEDGDLNNGHGNDCDGIDEQNPGTSTGVNLNGMGNGAHSECVQYLGVFALQDVEALEDHNVTFHIEGGRVIPDEQFAVKFTVVGADITSNGYKMPVTVQLQVGSTVIDPWGDDTKPLEGNVNDDRNPRKLVVQALQPAGTPISIKATSWVKNQAHLSGESDGHWKVNLSKDSATGTAHIKVLRNGSSVPSVAALTDASRIRDFLQDYINTSTDKVVLDENQAIFLFELGTTDLNYADYDDLAVLVTLSEDVLSLLNDADDDDVYTGPSSRLIKVDPETGAVQQMMTMNNTYDGLTATANGTFYATKGQELWRLNPHNQTETLVGTLPSAEVKGFESAGSVFCGFSLQSGKLEPINILTGASVASSVSVSVSDLQTIVFTQAPQIPLTWAGYD
jgi:hypothetical protein